MGFFSRMLENPRRRKRLEEAADQLWVHISMGSNFEVPLHLKRDDDYLETIRILQRKHPEVQMRMYQSKGLVIGLHKPGMSMDTSAEAMALLQKGHYFGTAGDMPIERMLDEHVAWLQARGFDPTQAEEDAQKAEAERHRIEVGTMAPAPEAPAVEAGVQAAAPETSDDRPSLDAVSESKP